MHSETGDASILPLARRPPAAVCSRVLLPALFAAIALLLLVLTLARLFGPGQPAIKQDLLLKLADFEYVCQLHRADVALLGPPTSTEPLQPGTAECCHWEATYPTLIGSNAFRLTFSFSRSEPQGVVVAGGLFKNGEAVDP